MADEFLFVPMFLRLSVLTRWRERPIKKKLTESLWALKWDLVMLTFLSASSSNNFLTNLTAPNLNSTATTSMIALAQHHVAVNSFHPSLKYTWIFSECSIAFLDINVSISGHGNRLSTSVHFKPTDLHSYLLHSSSHPAHVKNSIPYSQFLRL